MWRGRRTLFDFDLLDPTKIIPEETVPITMLGKLTLNRNPILFRGNGTGGILSGAYCAGYRLLERSAASAVCSRTDTQISRLGGPNFHEIPLTAPLRFDAQPARREHRMTVNRTVSYEPNSIDSGWPKETEPAAIAVVSDHRNAWI